MLFNRQPGVHEMLISVVLHASDDYNFVHVEQDGVVSSFGARLSGGEHHHLVWVRINFTYNVLLTIRMIHVCYVYVRNELLCNTIY